MEVMEPLKIYLSIKFILLFLGLSILIMYSLHYNGFDTVFRIKEFTITVKPEKKIPISDLLLSRDISKHWPEILVRPSRVNCSDNLLLIMLVTSYVGNTELRNVHRQVITDDMMKENNSTRIFLLAKVPFSDKAINQSIIDEEIKTYGDILQGDFYEHYRNLTVKHLMGLKWASTHCQKAKFIIKVDDDVVFNFENTIEYLKKLGPKDKLLGKLIRRNLVVRKQSSKWYVSPDEFNSTNYPRYLSGWFYIITPSVAAILVEESKYHKYFWIDDVFVTGVLTKTLNIYPRQFKLLLVIPLVFNHYIKDMFSQNIQFDHLISENRGDIYKLAKFNEAVRNCRVKNCTKDEETYNRMLFL